VLFGDSEDDDLIGGWGNDWISGGTGQDGVLGDDGRIFTSRGNATVGEPLYGIAALLATDPDPKSTNGNVLSELIDTPGEHQIGTINVAGALAKAVDLTPFNLTPSSIATDDPYNDPRHVDDIVFGGLGADFLHGGAGDDALSGAEAMAESYSQRVDAAGSLVGLVRTDFTRPFNPGDALRFNPIDLDGQHPNRDFAGEFALYDEYDPRRKLVLNANGTASKTGSGLEWFLNFVSNEGPTFPGGVTPKEGLAYGPVQSDGNDILFGDLGNDWLVGGTGKDDLWGGYGNDLLFADDDLSTNGGVNDTTDTHPMYEDRAFGGAGRDVLYANTGGDRLIDWGGEFNSYLVPFAPFGTPTVSRGVPPMLFEFLYALSRSDGADPTRAADTGNEVLRNGEPDGEIALVVQKDKGLWQDQHGGPADPQAGNIAGGKRDVHVTAGFNDGSPSGLTTASGLFTVSGGALLSTASGDAVSVVGYEELPEYYELTASLLTMKPVGGEKANAYVVFDYYSPTDFKFAGIDVSTNKIAIGHRTAQGWVVDSSTPMVLKADTAYSALVAVNGTAVTLEVGTKTVAYVFAPRQIGEWAYGLNTGVVGVASDNARAGFDDVVLQVIPSQMSFDYAESFTDGVANLFTGTESGSWQLVGGRYSATGDGAARTADLGLNQLFDSDAYLQLSAVLQTNGVGGLVFDRYGATDFKYVAIDAVTGSLVIGHRDKQDWQTDAKIARGLQPGVDYALQLTLKGRMISVSVDGNLVGSAAYDATVVHGSFGLLTRNGTTSFDAFRINTNEPTFANQASALVVEGGEAPDAGNAARLDEAMLAHLIEDGIRAWGAELGTALDSEGIRFALADLSGSIIGQTIGTTIYLDFDAVGNGWYLASDPKLTGRVDARTAVSHELGHALGFEHENAAEHEVMGDTIPLRSQRRPQVAVDPDGGAAASPAIERVGAHPFEPAVRHTRPVTISSGPKWRVIGTLAFPSLLRLRTVSRAPVRPLPRGLTRGRASNASIGRTAH